MDSERSFVPAGTAATILGLSVPMVRYLALTGKISFRLHGRSRVFSLDEIERVRRERAGLKKRGPATTIERASRLLAEEAV